LTCVKRATHFRLNLWATPAVGAIALTVAFCAVPAGAADYTWPVTRVIDGDTVVVNASADLPPELSRLAVRLDGVDTPEKGWRAKCAEEKKMGREARAFTKRQIDKAKRIVVRDPKWGTYGGRVIADLVLDGRSLSDALIEKGYGIPDRGRKTNKKEREENRRKRWCSDLGK